MLSEVLASSSTYGDGNHVQPYQKDLVSWASAGFVPVPIEQALSEPDDPAREPQRHLAVQHLGVAQPHRRVSTMKV